MATVKPAETDRARPPLECGVASVPLPGQDQSGDLHLQIEVRSGSLVAVVDGAGHGKDAAAAAEAAIETIRTNSEDDVAALARRCHDRLRDTRGAVLAMARFDAFQNTMTWLSIGNIEGVLLRADGSATSLLMRPGLAGSGLPALQPTIVAVSAGDVLVMTTDGIHGGLFTGVDLRGPATRIAENISARYSKGNDDGLVLVARYLGWPP